MCWTSDDWPGGFFGPANRQTEGLPSGPRVNGSSPGRICALRRPVERCPRPVRQSSGSEAAGRANRRVATGDPSAIWSHGDPWFRQRGACWSRGACPRASSAKRVGGAVPPPFWRAASVPITHRAARIRSIPSYPASSDTRPNRPACMGRLRSPPASWATEARCRAPPDRADGCPYRSRHASAGTPAASARRCSSSRVSQSGSISGTEDSSNSV